MGKLPPVPLLFISPCFIFIFSLSTSQQDKRFPDIKLYRERYLINVCYRVPMFAIGMMLLYFNGCTCASVFIYRGSMMIKRMVHLLNKVDIY